MNTINPFSLLIFLSVLLLGCNKDENEIIDPEDNRIHKIMLRDYGIRGKIDQEQNEIRFFVGALTDLSDIYMLIIIPEGASISPPKTERVNLTEPLSYTVTAPNGNNRIYTVSATMHTDTALLVVDLQNGYFPFYKDDSVLLHTRSMIDRVRSSGKEVIFIQTDYTSYSGENDSPYGSWKFLVHEDLNPGGDDHYVVKWGQDSFDRDTELLEVLNENELGALVVCGIATHACVHGTIEGGVAKGYRIIVAGNAHSSYNPGAQERINTYNQLKWPAMGIDVMNAEAIHF